nr:MAG TPA: hypothetical protein [Caudoviricetes sp.]DAZ78832.1 MAG TPA: hypothetical protein [Caudoviricetes sp.]
MFIICSYLIHNLYIIFIIHSLLYIHNLSINST